MDVEKVADKARKSISSYCIEECKAYCCRKGYLVLTPKEARKTTQKRLKELEKKEVITELENNDYVLYMGNKECPCPSLGSDFKCKIHKSKNRSQTCRTFPIFIEEETKTIKLSARCPAIREGKLYPFIAKFISMGYKVIEGGALDSNKDSR